MSSPSHNHFVTNSYTHNNLWRVLVRDRRITIIRTEYCWGKLIKVCKETQNGPSHRKIALNDEDQCHSLKCHISIYSLFRRQYLLDQKAFHLYLVKIHLKSYLGSFSTLKFVFPKLKLNFQTPRHTKLGKIHWENIWIFITGSSKHEQHCM